MPIPFPIAAASAASANDLAIFGPTGSVQTLTVPAGKTKMFARLWGAAGRSASASGANGGYAEGLIDVTEGETLYVVVGRTGEVHGATSATRSAFGAHYNAGELSGIFENASPAWTNSGTRDTAHGNAIIIAGGAGAPWNDNTGSYGGGATGGSNPAQEGSAAGGTQVAGGSSGTSGTPVAGDKLMGGYNGTGQRGGGSGYYGGGGTYYSTGNAYGGGGGSGYVGHSRVTDGAFATDGAIDDEDFWFAGVGKANTNKGTLNGCGLVICQFY